MALPDEIVVDQDNPNAGDYIYVSGRCYEKTETSGEEYEVTHDMVFGGMLDKKTVTISSPKDEPKELTSDRIDIMRVPFVGCGDCSSYGERYRGQIKETGKDFKIKVIKEIDTDKGNVFRYKLNGEDRNGIFNLETNRAILIYDNDSLIFDIESLNDEKAKFQVDNPTGNQTRSSDGNKLMIGKTRADAGLASIDRNKSSSISVGTFKYTESGDVGMGGELKIESNPYEANPQYSTEKLKQFPQRVLATSSGSFLIKNDGRVYVTGHNTNYALAVDRARTNSTRRTNLTRWTPSLINEYGPIKKIAGIGQAHAFLTYDNKLYMAGHNDRGQLGRNNETTHPFPKMVQINHSSSNEVINLSEDIHTRIVDVDCGHYHTVALDVNQRIWVWGTGNTFGANLLSFNNSNGGRADNKPDTGQSYGQAGWRYQTSPYNTYDSNQSLKGWNNGGHAKHNTRALLAYWGTTSTTTKNTAYIKTPDQFETKEENEHIRQIACGGYNTYILNNDGKVFSCGYNANGELGQGHTDKLHDVGYTKQPHPSFGPVSRTGGKLNDDSENKIWVKKVICGNRHTLLLTYDDKLYGFGLNHHGQLGLDPTTDPFRSAPFQISQDGEKVYTAAAGSNASAYITFDGKVKVAGLNRNGKLGLDRFIEAPVPQIRTSTETITAFTESPNLTGAIEISLGGQFTLAVLTDGQVVALGDNQYGNLGTRTSVYGNANSYTRFQDRDAGTNSNNLLHFGRDIDFKNTDKTLFSLPYTTIIWEKEDADQTVKAAGRSNVYQGGYFNATATVVGAEKDLTAINDTFGGTVLKQGAKIKKIVASNTDTVKILNDKNELWSYGLGDRFQHGNNSASNVATPVQPIVNGSPLVDIVNVAGGYYHTIALDNKNRLWGYGTGNTFGALIKTYANSNGGRADNQPDAGQSYGQAGWRYQTSPYNTYDSNQSLKGWNNGGHAKTQNTPVLLNDGSTRVLPDYVGRIVDIQCSYYATYILNEDGELFSCGYNGNGELGQGRADKYYDVGSSPNILHLSFGQVYPYTSVLDARIKKVIPGGSHCLVIMEDNKLYGWGANGAYQLGLSEGNTEGRVYSDKHYYPQFIADDVEDAWAGPANSAYKKLDGSVYAMGRNANGQLASFGDGRTLGLDRYDELFGLKGSTATAKMPIPWFEASDRILEIAFGSAHSVVKRARTNDSGKTYLDWYSAGNNTYGQRGIGKDPGGKVNEWTGYDHQQVDSSGTVTYKGSDKWQRIQTMLLD